MLLCLTTVVLYFCAVLEEEIFSFPFCLLSHSYDKLLEYVL